MTTRYEEYRATLAEIEALLRRRASDAHDLPGVFMVLRQFFFAKGRGDEPKEPVSDRRVR